MAIEIDAIEAFFEILAINENPTVHIAPTKGNSTQHPPAPVATPLPPLNFLVIGKTCPRTDASQQAKPNEVSSISKPAAADIDPLLKSAIRTKMPARRPATRKTFVAPGFPEPDCVGSKPFLWETRCAEGRLPKK